MFLKYIKHKTAILLCALLLVQGCSPAAMIKDAFVLPAEWEFIQSVGGLTLGMPYIADGNFWLPLTMDLSGNNPVSTTPTLNNSGQKCLKATLMQGDGMIASPGYYDIELQVYAGDRSKRVIGGCDEVPMFVGDFSPPLANRDAVIFRVWYRESVLSKHFIGNVRL